MRYTNFILTVIALCLLAMLVRGLDFIPPAAAQAAAQRVVIVGWQSDTKGLPVIVTNSLLPVTNGWGSNAKLVPLWTTAKDPNQ